MQTAEAAALHMSNFTYFGMPQYDVIHVAKHSGGVSSKVEQEEDRTEKETRNADPSRAFLNFSVRASASDPGRLVRDKLKWSPLTKQERLDQCLARQTAITITDKRGRTYTKKATIRKDAITHFDLIISGSHDTLHTLLMDDLKDMKSGKAQRPERISKWAADNYRWLAERAGGAENIITFNVHLDETTPHIQATICPMYNGRLNQKGFFDGPEGLKQLRTDHAEKVGSKYRLERGVEGSKAEHQSIRDFYRAMKRYELRNQTMADISKIGFSEADYRAITRDTDNPIPSIDTVPTPPLNPFQHEQWVKDINDKLARQMAAKEEAVAKKAAEKMATKAAAALREADSQTKAAIMKATNLQTENSQLKGQLKISNLLRACADWAVQVISGTAAVRKLAEAFNKLCNATGANKGNSAKEIIRKRKIEAQRVSFDCMGRLAEGQLDKLGMLLDQIACNLKQQGKEVKL